MTCKRGLVVWVVVIAGFCSGGKTAAGQQSSKQANPNNASVVKTAAKVSKVELLASKNKPPLLRDGQFISVDKAFEWKEQDRCWRAIHDLLGQAESVWPELVAHLDDRRYCVTIHNEIGGAVWNWSIGDVCHHIIGRTLTEPFYPHLEPESKELYGFVRRFPMDRSALKKWFGERKEKPLYELQRDACLEVSRQLKTKELLPREDAETRARWVATIEKWREKLARSQTSVLSAGFGVDEIRPLEEDTGEDPFAD